MKIKLTSDLIVNIIIGLALSSTFLTWGLLMFASNTTRVGNTDDGMSFAIINNLKPITEHVSDSIPYYQHVRLQDSINQLRTLRNGDGPIAGSANYISLFGTQESNYCDTCTIRFSKGAWPSEFPIFDKPRKAYFMLMGWKIKPAKWPCDSVKFHVEHGQAYLRKQVADSTYKDKKGRIERIVRTYDIAVPFAYNRQFNCVTIPITASTKTMLDYVLTTISILGIIYFMFFILGGFIKFLLDVSRGQTFTVKNIRRLKVIGISLIVIEILNFLINLCMPLVFHAYFTADVVLDEKSWSGSWKGLVTGIAFLLLYKAFRSGKKIKEEQDLVI